MSGIGEMGIFLVGPGAAASVNVLQYCMGAAFI